MIKTQTAMEKKGGFRQRHRGEGTPAPCLSLQLGTRGGSEMKARDRQRLGGQAYNFKVNNSL